MKNLSYHKKYVKRKQQEPQKWMGMFDKELMRQFKELQCFPGVGKSWIWFAKEPLQTLRILARPLTDEEKGRSENWVDDALFLSDDQRAAMIEQELAEVDDDEGGLLDKFQFFAGDSRPQNLVQKFTQNIWHLIPAKQWLQATNRVGFTSYPNMTIHS